MRSKPSASSERTRRTLREASGREPSEAELGARLGMPVDKVRLLLEAARQPYSLDAPTGENEEQAIGALIRDRTVPRPEDEVISRELASRIEGALEPLTEREREVVRLRYGFAATTSHARRSRPQAGVVTGARATDRSARGREASERSSRVNIFTARRRKVLKPWGTLFRRRYTPSCPRW